MGLFCCGRIGFVPIPLDGEPFSAEAGACATPCSNTHGSADCVTGSCSLTCDPDFGDCNADPADGCEADLSTGVTGDCGACGRLCQAHEMCTAGACEPSGCAPGFAECDADPTEMCETDLMTRVDHCGGCSAVCPQQNATTACVDGTCRMLACTLGFDDCDNNPENGCETDVSANVQHCGACNDSCANDHGSTACVDSACVPDCDEGYADCDGSTRNGCERQVEAGSDCGLCGDSCPAEGDPGCDLSGTWALKLNTTVSWSETMYVASSADQPFAMTLRVQITQSEGHAELQLTECARETPEYEAKFPNERSQLAYPQRLYDANALPSISMVTSLGSTSPGSAFFVPAVAAQLGISLNDPVNAAWPSDEANVPAAYRIDMDRDGKDGVTATYTNTPPYYYPRTTPLITLTAPRSDTLYVAARAVFSLSGTLTSCTESTGSAGFSRIDTRIFGCTIAGTLRECDGIETNRIDDSVMHFTPQSGTYTLRKVADSADCATVRAALP